MHILASDFSHDSSGKGAVDQALQHIDKLDGLIINHGTLGEVQLLANSSGDGWRKTFDVNFFSVVEIVQAALPALRKSKGRIIFTSSGSATKGGATWGAYGASKAALNHLAMTLQQEGPQVTTVSVRPGMVDTQMQTEIREVHGTTMREADREKYMNAKTKGFLLRPEQPGNVLAKMALGVPHDLSGSFVSWNDEVLKDFQD